MSASRTHVDKEELGINYGVYFSILARSISLHSFNAISVNVRKRRPSPDRTYPDSMNLDMITLLLG